MRQLGVQMTATQKRLLLALTAVTALATATPTASRERFQGLGFLPGFNESRASGVNADGTVVVGDAVTPGAQAFRWVNGTMTGLGFLTASGVNADGTVVVGTRFSAGRSEAVRWVNGTVTGLGFLPKDTSSQASGVNADGTVVVGLSSNGAGVIQAVRWVNGAVTGLGFLPSSSGTFSEARGVSANGKVVVGNDQIVVGGVVRSQAFRWVNGTMTGLGFLPGGTFSSASGVNANGRVVVGESFNNENQAFRWVNGTMTGLGFLPGGQFSVAFGVSANGKVVVGDGCCTGVSGAFRWTAATGMQSVKALLQAAGVDIPGWQLGIATAVSADGTTIVGNGRDPNGQRQAWIADLSDLCFAEGMPVLRLDDDGNPVFLRARCEDDDHDQGHGEFSER